MLQQLHIKVITLKSIIIETSRSMCMLLTLTVWLAVKLANASSLLKKAVGSRVSGDMSEKGSSLEDTRPFCTGDST